MADNLSQRKRDLEEIKQLSLEILKVENDSAVSDEKRLAKLDTLIKKRKTLGNQIKEGKKSKKEIENGENRELSVCELNYVNVRVMENISIE